jgi:DMSO/TMAO reductase YedYZ heme-binding membrane subunit
MNSRLTMRFGIEAAFACASALLFVLTLVWRDWIEVIFGVDPDRGSGTTEWAVVAALLLATLVGTLVARAEFRRGHSAQLADEPT